MKYRIALLTALFSASAQAQEATADKTAEALANIGEVINWGGVGSSVLLLVGAWLLIKFVDNVVDELSEAFTDKRLLIHRLNAFFHFFVYLGATTGVILLSFDFKPQVLALIGGGIAVAVGFAMRDLLASLVAGFMIVFDRPFQVGDRVNMGGEYGDVLAIGIRSVQLRTLDDSVVTVPNSLFFTEVSSSANFGVLDMQIDTDFYIGIDQNAALASALVHEAAVISRFVHLPKPLIVNVEQVQLDSLIALRIRLKAYVLDTLYEKRFTTDVTLRVMTAFAENDISPPVILHRQATSE